MNIDSEILRLLQQINKNLSNNSYNRTDREESDIRPSRVGNRSLDDTLKNLKKDLRIGISDMMKDLHTPVVRVMKEKSRILETVYSDLHKQMTHLDEHALKKLSLSAIDLAKKISLGSDASIQFQKNINGVLDAARVFANKIKERENVLDAIKNVEEDLKKANKKNKKTLNEQLVALKKHKAVLDANIDSLRDQTSEGRKLIDAMKMSSEGVEVFGGDIDELSDEFDNVGTSTKKLDEIFTKLNEKVQVVEHSFTEIADANIQAATNLKKAITNIVQQLSSNIQESFINPNSKFWTTELAAIRGNLQDTTRIDQITGLTGMSGLEFAELQGDYAKEFRILGKSPDKEKFDASSISELQDAAHVLGLTGLDAAKFGMEVSRGLTMAGLKPDKESVISYIGNISGASDQIGMTKEELNQFYTELLSGNTANQQLKTFDKNMADFAAKSEKERLDILMDENQQRLMLNRHLGRNIEYLKDEERRRISTKNAGFMQSINNMVASGIMVAEAQRLGVSISSDDKSLIEKRHVRGIKLVGDEANRADEIDQRIREAFASSIENDKVNGSGTGGSTNIIRELISGYGFQGPLAENLEDAFTEQERQKTAEFAAPGDAARRIEAMSDFENSFVSVAPDFIQALQTFSNNEFINGLGGGLATVIGSAIEYFMLKRLLGGAAGGAAGNILSKVSARLLPVLVRLLPVLGTFTAGLAAFSVGYAAGDYIYENVKDNDTFISATDTFYDWSIFSGFKGAGDLYSEFFPDEQTQNIKTAEMRLERQKELMNRAEVTKLTPEIRDQLIKEFPNLETTEFAMSGRQVYDVSGNATVETPDGMLERSKVIESDVGGVGVDSGVTFPDFKLSPSTIPSTEELNSQDVEKTMRGEEREKTSTSTNPSLGRTEHQIMVDQKEWAHDMIDLTKKNFEINHQIFLALLTGDSESLETILRSNTVDRSA